MRCGAVVEHLQPACCSGFRVATQLCMVPHVCASTCNRLAAEPSTRCVCPLIDTVCCACLRSVCCCSNAVPKLRLLLPAATMYQQQQGVQHPAVQSAAEVPAARTPAAGALLRTQQQTHQHRALLQCSMLPHQPLGPKGRTTPSSGCRRKCRCIGQICRPTVSLIHS